VPPPRAGDPAGAGMARLVPPRVPSVGPRCGAARRALARAAVRRVRPDQSRYGYRQSVGGTNVSLIVRAAPNRRRLSAEPALSSVPDARAPPNGCWPTTAPVGLSLM